MRKIIFITLFLILLQYKNAYSLESNNLFINSDTNALQPQTDRKLSKFSISSNLGIMVFTPTLSVNMNTLIFDYVSIEAGILSNPSVIFGRVQANIHLKDISISFAQYIIPESNGNGLNTGISIGYMPMNNYHNSFNFMIRGGAFFYNRYVIEGGLDLTLEFGLKYNL